LISVCQKYQIRLVSDSDVLDDDYVPSVKLFHHCTASLLWIDYPTNDKQAMATPVPIKALVEEESQW